MVIKHEQLLVKGILGLVAKKVMVRGKKGTHQQTVYVRSGDKPKSDDRMTKLAANAKEMTSDDLDMDATYESFKKNYMAALGTSWSKGKFLSRARNWTFYGDDTGQVAVRIQRSGLYKLAGVAGSPRGILKGMAKLIADKKPIWGMVSKDLQTQSHKMGLKTPPAFVIKQVIKKIPKEVFGGVDYTIEKDGGVTFEYSDVGKTTKYFIGSPAYYKKTMALMGKKLPAPMRLLMNKLTKE